MTTTFPDEIQVGAPNILRAYAAEPDAVRQAEPGTPIKFVATTAGVKRDGLDLELDGLDTSNFERNPVFLWAHNYRMPPIGKVTKIQRQKTKVVMWVVFDQGDEFALEIERKYREGFLTAVSIGWIILDFERVPEESDSDARFIITASDLLDLSAVPVPGDPDALMPRELSAVRALADHREHGTTPNIVNDVTTDANPDTNTYEWVRAEDDTPKVCSHINDEGEADWQRVATEMVELLESGTEDPESYTHLTRHYRKLGKTPPEMIVDFDLAETRGLLLEGEWETRKEARVAETTARVREAIDEAIEALEDLRDAFDPDEPNEDGTTVRDALTSIRDAFVAPPEDDDEGEDDPDAN